jgi:hypothetical protein
MTSPLLVLDVAHPARHPDIVEEALLTAWREVQNSTVYRGIKVIHGYGKSGAKASTRETVRNWTFRMRGKFRAVIDGEHYSLHHPAVLDMRREAGTFPDPDLDRANPGITVLIVK